VPVEELHTIANGLGQRRTGEGRIKWLKVQLKNKVVVGAEMYTSKYYDLNLFQKIKHDQLIYKFQV
jgi:hypothetical protein